MVASFANNLFQRVIEVISRLRDLYIFLVRGREIELECLRETDRARVSEREGEREKKR